MKLRYPLISFLLMLCSLTWGQTKDRAVWEDYLMEVVNMEDYDEAELQDVYEHLWELESQPLNINDATYEDMCQIPGMTIDNISDIMLYRDKYGALKSMAELALIPGISREMRLLLSCFFVAEPAETDKFNRNSKRNREWWKGERLDSLMKRGHGTILATGSVPLYKRKGDETSYLGDRYRYGIKVKGNYSDYVKYGFIGAQDAGEPFFKDKNKWGFDHYAFFLNINKVGRLKSLVAGNYRLKMAQGLVMNNGFALGKQFLLTSIGSYQTTMTGHASRSDNYLQGVAATIDLSRKPYYATKPYDKDMKVELTAFWSYRKVDATLNKDGTVATLLTSGYHRTPTEMGKKNNTSVLMTGAHVIVRKGVWHMGMSGVYDWYDRPLMPSLTDYRHFYPRGDSFWNASVDYGYTSGSFIFNGETATGGCGAVATMNSALIKLRNRLQLTAVQRYYSHQYYAMAAKSFSEGESVQNENGFYLGMQYPLLRYVTVDAYTDIVYYPWRRYLSLSGAYAWDNSLSMTYSRRQWTVQGRYRYHLRQRTNKAKTANADTGDHTMRLVVTRDGGSLMLRTEADYHFYTKELGQSNGYMIAEMATLKVRDKLSFSLAGCYFDTDDYDTRVYMHEKGMLESFSFSSVYGRGFRVSAVIRADISRKWMLMAKVGHTKYFDRSEISSSDRTIFQSYKTDIDLQARMRF